MLKVGLIGNGGIAVPHKAAYEKLEDALSESERAELSEQILKLLFEMTPVSSKFITAKDATIETVIDWLVKSQEHAGKCVSWFEEYFDKNASPKVFDFLIRSEYLNTIISAAKIFIVPVRKAVEKYPNLGSSKIGNAIAPIKPPT